MYERTREFASFDIAGFSHWYGAECLEKLEVGAHLDMQLESDNPYDPNAIALFFKGTKLGYVPRSRNYEISQLMFFGYEIFDAVVVRVDPKEHPENQVRITVFVRDGRKG